MTGIPRTDDEWEGLFAPYDADTYEAALAALERGDTVLDLGAGDLRFAKRAAAVVTKVFAVERRIELLPDDCPPNVRVICADARALDFPECTASVLLMRHCQHFSLYRAKLERAGCRKLITNARWGMGVEVIDLRGGTVGFQEFLGGWYACRCGKVGFKPNEVSGTEFLAQVKDCPACFQNGN